MAARSVLLAFVIPAFAQKQAGADYQQYAAQYGDYQKYMSGMAPGSESGKDASASAGYQKYYKNYMSQYGDYQKYMQGMGGSGGSGGYQKFMDQYSGGQTSKSTSSDKEPVSLAAEAHESQSKDSQGGAGDYMAKYAADYQKYMQGQGKGSQGGAGGYMAQYADYQKYMQGQGKGSQGGAGDYMEKYAADYQQYADYQKYMQSQGKGGDIMNFQKYLGEYGSKYRESMNQYAGKYVTQSSDDEAKPAEKASSDNSSTESKPKSLAALAPQVLVETSGSESQNSGNAVPDEQQKEEEHLQTERQEEKQRLHDELAEEKARLQKELESEKESLREELQREAETEAEKSQGSAKTPEMLEEQAPSSRFSKAAPAVLAALFAMAAILGLQRHNARPTAATDDYMMQLEPPLAAV